MRRSIQLHLHLARKLFRGEVNTLPRPTQHFRLQGYLQASITHDLPHRAPRATTRLQIQMGPDGHTPTIFSG